MLVFVFYFDLFKFSAAILQKGLFTEKELKVQNTKEQMIIEGTKS